MTTSPLGPEKKQPLRQTTEKGTLEERQVSRWRSVPIIGWIISLIAGPPGKTTRKPTGKNLSESTITIQRAASKADQIVSGKVSWNTRLDRLEAELIKDEQMKKPTRKTTTLEQVENIKNALDSEKMEIGRLKEHFKNDENGRKLFLVPREKNYNARATEFNNILKAKEQAELPPQSSKKFEERLNKLGNALKKEKLIERFETYDEMNEKLQTVENYLKKEAQEIGKLEGKAHGPLFNERVEQYKEKFNEFQEIKEEYRKSSF